jgi:hypothetical protein
MRCPNCEAEVPEGEKFCPQCGVPVAGMEKCPHCGAALLPGERFCGECGREVAVAQPLPGTALPVLPPVGGTVTTKKRSPWLWVGIAAGVLVVLGCLGACLIVALSGGSPTPTPTLTSTPLPTATPTPGPQPGALLYQEDFTAPGSEWDNQDQTDVAYRFDEGEYSIEVRKANWMAWDGTSGSYGDFVLDLDASLVDGDPYNAYGCLFRYQDKNNHYEFDMNGNGSYTIGKDVNDEWIKLVDWTAHPAIKAQGEVNHIRLIAYGDIFTVYINGEFVNQFTDSTFESGDVAPVVTSYDTPPARATFDNIQVWSVEVR